MKHLLLDLLARNEPSASALHTCMALLSRDVLTAAEGTSHDGLLRKGRDAALDTALYLEQAAQTSRVENLDHADLLGAIQRQVQQLDRDLAEYRFKDKHAGLKEVRDRLKDMLLQHETARTMRALRHR